MFSWNLDVLYGPASINWDGFGVGLLNPIEISSELIMNLTMLN